MLKDNEDFDLLWISTGFVTILYAMTLIAGTPIKPLWDLAKVGLYLTGLELFLRTVRFTIRGVKRVRLAEQRERERQLQTK